MIAEIRGIRICYERLGAGRPLVMLHGNGEDHTIFDQAAPLLAGTYEVWLPDTRGHGGSDQVQELHYSDMADDLIALLEQNDLQDVIVYGFSDGGITGLLAAMKCSRITDLIVSGANLTPDGVMEPMRTVIWIMAEILRDPKAVLMNSEPELDPRDLAAIKARTLVLAGDHDLIYAEETRRIAENIPNAELRFLQAENHGSYIVHSRKIGDLLLGWLNQENCSHEV